MKHHILLATCAASVLTLAAGSALAADAAAANASGTTIGELVVTAERREENLQDTPIAVSAFSAQSLSSKGLNGGQDLLLQVPNANYSRSNFGGFDFKIRGIGVDVVAFSGTTGVSINENELPVASNNFANTDFYDVQRVEVLRGPQGTLYGRNATGGAVDIITNQPTSDFGGYASVGYGNYDAIKVTGAVNIPLGDDWALRVAGFRYLQNGFGENTYLNQSVDGRDLGSVRATLSFKPNDKFNAYIMYEHYGENDDRNRIGKQLCITDPGPSNVGGVPIAAAGGTPVGNILNNYAAFLNQGCLPGSLNQPAAYGAVNSNATFLATGNLFGLNNGTNVFRDNPLQDTNLHDIQSITQPRFTSYEDLIEIHASYNISNSLTLTSITGFNRATGTSLEDYNRIVPDLPFTPTNNAFLGLFGANANAIFPNGEVNDPQIGTTNKFATFDYGTAESNEYTEELRLQSSFKGPVNFSAGLFYSEETSPLGSNNYFVFSNALTGAGYANNALGGALLGGPIYTDPSQVPTGAGHNYYDARDGGGFLKTYAGFAEVYWQITPTLKLTLGGRYNVDQLYNISYPISVLVAVPNGTQIQTNGYPGNGGLGTTGYAGFPTTICTTSLASCLIPQGVTYREFTGRANLDWSPILSFTDKTLVYASYSRGYKGGGFNTPCQTGLGTVGSVGNNCPYPLSYNPEFIDAYEIGTKNTLLGGSLTLDADAFYYNYNGYQISSIVDKSSVNLNINAKIYGAEFESAYSPFRNFTVNANVGYLHTRIDNNQFEVDTINLTQGNPNYTLLHADDGTACLAPTNYLAALIAGGAPAPFLNSGVIPPSTTPAFAGACTAAGYATGNAIAGNANYVNFNDVNGVPVNLGGKQLPNAPNWTISAGAQYVFDLPDDWRATLRGDYYWQGQSWARVFNAVNDRLLAYHVVNATLTFAQSTNGLEVKLWVKNLFNAQPITGVYLTNDTSGLFQNVFTLDPRTYGVQLTKRF